jgi:hypothetical protein
VYKKHSSEVRGRSQLLDGDSKIGLPEAIYILQKAAGVRP